MGALLVIVFTISVLNTTTNTAANAKQKWHLFLPISLIELLKRKVSIEQNPLSLSISQGCAL
jgi:hypothetical protein